MLVKQKDVHQEAELKVEEYAIECSILKVAVSEDVQNCADEGIQIYGGMGFSEDTNGKCLERCQNCSYL
jgi:alkylation response protein AidB-like acyl-CoA dehydrogenase